MPPIIPPYALMMSGLWLATSPRFTWPCTEERNPNALIPEANVVASAAFAVDEVLAAAIGGLILIHVGDMGDHLR